MLRKKIIAIIVISVLLLISLPLAIDWFIIGNDFPSNVNNSDWMSFLGGYVGAILSGAISLIGIIWTIKFTREQNRADRELQIRPYFDIRYRDVPNPCHTDNWLGAVLISTWEDDENQNVSNTIGYGLLYLKNIGNGPATDIKVEVHLENISMNYNAIYSVNNAMVTTSFISSNKESEISIDINNSNKVPAPHDLKWDENGIVATWDKNEFRQPSDFKIKLKIKYKDLLSNGFEQVLIIDTMHYHSCHKKKSVKYHCQLNLVKIDNPKKIKS